MAVKTKAVVVVLALAGLTVAAYLAIDRLMSPKPRTIADLDLTLLGIPLETTADGGSYANHDFPRRARAVTMTAPWRSGGPSLVDLPDSRELILPYAGVGLGPFQLSMDLASLDLTLDKDKSSRRVRAFAGIGYRPSAGLAVTLEYRSLAQGVPLFAIDLGNLNLDLDHPFGDQTVTVNLSYRM